MPTAQFSRSVDLRTSPNDIWSAIIDVGRVVDWVGIVHGATEVEPLRRYRAALQDRLGPFKLRADLDIEVSEVVEGRRIAGRAHGEDRQVGSRIAVRAELLLDERHDGTTVTVNGNYEVSGRVATLGASMINNKAGKILDEFFGRLAEELG